MKTLPSVASGFCIVAAVGLSVLACGPTILFADSWGGQSGDGGAGGGLTGAGGDLPSSSGTGLSTPSGCPADCEVPSGNLVCACKDSCAEARRVRCEWVVNALGETKLQCICSVEDFSGVCFQKDEDLACDFLKGCCAKYFSGK